MTADEFIYILLNGFYYLYTGQMFPPYGTADFFERIIS